MRKFLSLSPSFVFLAGMFALPAASAIGAKESVARAEFSLIDSDRSGGIRVMELARYRRDPGSVSWLLKSSTWLEFTRADSNGDDLISPEEWVAQRMFPAANLLGDQVRRFRSADRNGDGKLNTREVRAAFLPRLSAQEGVDTVAWLDSDSDKLLSMGEFFRYVNLGPDAMRGMRRVDAEDLLQAIGGTFYYTMYNGAVIDYFAPVHALYWLRSDANVITACGYGIDLDFLVGGTDAEAVTEAGLCGLLPASPMSPGIIPILFDGDLLDRLPPIFVDWDRPHPAPLNFGSELPLRPYLVIYSRGGVVEDLQITMGSPPYP